MIMADENLTLLQHLHELRSKLIRSVIFIIAASCLSYGFVGTILPYLVKPVGRLVFIAPQEAFISNIKIAVFSGILLSSPFVLWEIWLFIRSALKEKEKKYILIFGPLSFIFFILGAAFGYFVIVPIGIKFLLNFATEVVRPMITISRYISFVGLLTFAFGIIFELPLVTLFLTKLGIVTPKVLSSKRKEAIVGIFILAAVLTPPDMITQILMALPLICLYEIGIIFSKLAHHRHP